MPGVNTSAVVLFDNSSTATLITHEYAAIAGYSGRPVNYALKATGFPVQQRSTTLYSFDLCDNTGQYHAVEALGIDLITDIPAKVDLSRLMDTFPKAPTGVWERPAGKVDIMLGANYRQLQPAGGLRRDGCAVDGLRLSESVFGCGWVCR